MVITMTQNQTIAFACSELTRYLTQMGAGSIPDITVKLAGDVVGLMPVDDPQLDDVFALTASEMSVTITATNPRAVLLGVYRLLHELGCRFLGPTPKDELIPPIAKQFKVDLCERASYRHRGVCIEGANSLENILDFISWCPKVGFNSFFVQFREPNIFLRRWYEHMNNPMQPREQPDTAWLEAACRQIDDAIALRTLLHHRVGHGWTTEVIGGKDGWEHENTQLPPDRELLVALVNGRRELIKGIATNTNLCYANQAAVRELVDVIVSYATQHPKVDYLHVWLADEHNNLCECERCIMTTLSDQYVELLNQLDRELAVQKCDSRIVLLLYQELLWPPIHARLNNPKRFLLMFAPISRTFMSSYADVTLVEHIPPYRRNRIELPKTLEENLSFLRGWQADNNLDSFVYDYPLGRAHYGDLGYLHISRIISRDIHALRQLGLNGYISCQELRAALPNSMPNYVMGRTLWDNRLAFETLEREYFAAAYGDGEAGVRAYLDNISRLSDCDYFNNKMTRLQPRLAEQFAELANYACRSMPDIVPVNALQERYLQRLNYHRDYCSKLANALAALASGDNEGRDSCWQEFASFICSNEPAYQPQLDVYRIIEVATNYTGLAVKN